MNNLLVYNASAGSGKTYTLVQEYLKLALKGENPRYFEKILAITFTRKAAAEMKVRVIETLEDLCNTSPSNKQIALLKDYSEKLQLPESILKARAEAVLKAVLHNYANLAISTIDRFVQKLVRSFSKDLNLPGDFDVLLDHEDILQSAIDDLLNQVGSDPFLSETLVQFLFSLLEEEKSWNIQQQLVDFSKLLFREDSIEPIAKLKSLTTSNFVALQKKILNTLQDKRKELESLAKQILQLLNENGIQPEDFNGGKTRSPLLKYKWLAEDGAYFESAEIKLTFVEIGTEKNWYAASASSQVKASIDQISDKLLKLHQQVLEILNGPHYFPLVEVYSQIYNLSLIHQINDRLQALKEERSVLFIEDFNAIISEIVLNEPAPFIFEKIGEWYAHILIDEFQDTSIMQWHNFIPLIENALSNGTQCMLVGDAKQAIYRFRSGEVEQLAALPKLFGSDKNDLLKEREALFIANYQSKILDTNYRSRSTIVDFNNRLFNNIGTNSSELIAKVFQNASQKALVDKPGGLVNYQIVKADTALEKSQLQMELAFSHALECLSDGFARREIVFLVRSKKEGSHLAKFLTDKGHDVISPDSLLLGTSLNVQLLVNSVHYMEDANNEECKAKIIERLEIFHNNANGVAEVIEQFKTDGKIKLNLYFESRGYIFSLKQLRKLPLYQLGETLIELFLSDQKDLFSNAFLDCLFEFSGHSSSRLEFLNYWNNTASQKAILVDEMADAFQIMTIHKSKGLQFPVVILPFVDWDMKITKANIWLDISIPQIELRTSLFKNSKARMYRLGAEELFDYEELKTQLDHLNLLYVAFTRPEERLYIITSESIAKNQISTILNANLPDILTDKVSNNQASLGERSSYTTPEKKQQQFLEISTSASPDWRSRIKIAYRASKEWGDNELYNSARFGNFVHDIISTSASLDEALTEIKTLVESGKIDETEEKEFQVLFESIFSNAFIQDMFSESNFLTEHEIVDHKGNIHRPDRIVFKSDATWVIDFKTGQELEIHKGQVRNYAKLLEQMGYTSIKKCLFYTRNQQFVEVD